MISGTYAVVRAGGTAAFALLLLGTVLHAAPAQAQVAEAREAYFAAEFERATRLFEDVLGNADAPIGELAEAHRYLGALRLLLGEPDAAERHVQMAVALDPEAAPPEGVPPAVEQAFADARGEAQRVPPGLSIGTGDVLANGESATFTAQLDGSLPLVHRLQLRCTSGEAEEEVSGPAPSIMLDLVPNGETARCEAAGLNQAGAALLQASYEDSVGAGAGGDDGPLLAGIVGGIAGALAVAGAIVLIVVFAGDGGNSDVASVGQPRVEW